MKATFVELPLFERIRKDYLDDDTYSHLQQELMSNPEAGDMIEGTGGLRKLRQPDPRRGKGKRGVYASFTTGGWAKTSFCCLRCLTKTKQMI